MRIAVIGCGVMGSAFARAWAKEGHTLHLSDHTKEKGEALASEIGGVFFNSPGEAAREAEVILLGIKPKDVSTAAEDIGQISPEKIVLSILSGLTLSDLQEEMEGGICVRTMPNLALLKGEGITAIAEDPDLEPHTKEVIESLLKPLGIVVWAPEKDIDAITALAGSGPSFVCALAEAFTEAGIKTGLKAEQALELTLHMMKGAIALMEEDHPAKIRWRICSPGGTTIAGHRAFEEFGVRAGIMETVLAAYEKAREMGRREKL